MGVGCGGDPVVKCAAAVFAEADVISAEVVADF